MNNLMYIEIPIIKDSIIFEHICKDIIKNKGEYEQVQFNGRPGQPQDGVGIFARYNRQMIHFYDY
jgi:hypothetical protein